MPRFSQMACWEVSLFESSSSSVFFFFCFEVAVVPAAVSIKLIYPTANPSLLWRIRAFSDVEKPFLFSDLAALTAKSENKKGL